MRSSIVLVFAGVSFATVAAAGDMDSAYLRGSRAYEATPSYQIAPVMPSDEYAPPSRGAVMAPVPAASGYAFEFGARYWYSSGRLAKDLYDDPRFSTDIVSRLTYDGLTANAFEMFGKIALPSNLFIKGYAGISGLAKGSLNDEDFPPLTNPYSSTMSSQSGGRLGYVTADLGYGFAVSPSTSVSVFAGYAYVGEKVNAYGCNQVGSNPFICVPAIATNVLGITEDAHWHAARLGVGVEFKPIEKLTLSMEAAWLPVVQLRSHDTHWLRLGSTLGSFSGPIPETAAGTGFQLEALLAYQVWDCFSIGLGGRYWRLDARGGADLEQMIVGVTNPATQPIEFVSERYGVFLQGSYKFNL
jgi:opacity protein-like surface antigen